MAKFTWSEIFYSIEGESKYSGFPTIYFRNSLCNFQCKGFNNPDNLDTTSIEVLGFNPKDYTDIYSIPLITKGCDSIYSWDPKFAHMWKKGDEHDVAEGLLNLLPGRSMINPNTGLPVILSITGGEPTVQWKKLPALFNTPELVHCKHILIETNCSVAFKLEFIMEINKWLAVDPERKWTWSNSPKLSSSGEKWEEAIVPKVAAMQRLACGPEFNNQMDQYFKFVCGPTNEDFDEVAKAMEEYYTAGIPRKTAVYIMPMACTEEQQQSIASQVAHACMERGYIYSHRIQNSIFGNKIGT